jgi:hypothetical protein
MCNGQTDFYNREKAQCEIKEKLKWGEVHGKVVRVYSIVNDSSQVSCF